MIDMVEFHPIRVGALDTLNRAFMFVSNIWKHALVIFLYKRKSFLLRRNVVSNILPVVGAAHTGIDCRGA